MKQLITSDDEKTVIEIFTVNQPGEGETDDDPMFPRFHRAHCRDCGWDSFADDGTFHFTEGDAINDADTHLDDHLTRKA
jgi:hypothetical protein